MIINSVGSSFTGTSGSSQNTGGTSNQTDPASDDGTTSGSGQAGGTEASGSTGTPSGSQASSGQAGGQASGQGGSQAASPGVSRQSLSRTDVSTPAAILSVEAEKPSVDDGTLRSQALEAQKRLNTEMLIKSLGAAAETDLSLLSEAETEAPVPLAVAAYAENFKPSSTDSAKSAA